MLRRFAPGRRAVVTTHAIAGDRAMVETGGGEARRRMTIVTAITAGDMRSRLAPGYPVVVATLACADNRAMIDTRDRRKASGLVAVFAGVGCIDMLRRFSFRGSVVVTTDTGSLYFVMIHDRNPSEPGRRVTTFALVGRSGMSRRHGRRGDETAGLMTVAAAFGRAPENPAHMAAFAIDPRVHAR